MEEEVLERARNKLMLEWITIQRGVTDKDAKELTDTMARVGKAVAEPNSSEDISRILKRRGEKMLQQSGNQKKLEELDTGTGMAGINIYQRLCASGARLSLTLWWSAGCTISILAKYLVNKCLQQGGHA